MDDRVFMVPAPGVRLTHPAGSPRAMKPIPASGEWLRLTDYWLRRELDGSIVRATPPADPPADTTTKPAATPAAKGKG